MKKRVLGEMTRTDNHHSKDMKGSKDMEGQRGYFKSVGVLPGHKLEVETATGSKIEFDFTTRLDTMRFGLLKDEEVFATAFTDGNSIIFQKDGRVRVVISAEEFLDLLMVDRTGGS